MTGFVLGFGIALGLAVVLVRMRDGLPKPTLSEWREHRKALRYFLRNETSLGCYGDSDDLHRTRAALRFFASLEPACVDEALPPHGRQSL